MRGYQSKPDQCRKPVHRSWLNQQYWYTETKSQMILDEVASTEAQHHLLPGDPAMQSQFLSLPKGHEYSWLIWEPPLIFPGEETPACPEKRYSSASSGLPASDPEATTDKWTGTARYFQYNGHKGTQTYLSQSLQKGKKPPQAGLLRQISGSLSYTLLFRETCDQFLLCPNSRAPFGSNNRRHQMNATLLPTRQCDLCSYPWFLHWDVSIFDLGLAALCNWNPILSLLLPVLNRQ